jgi:hypothetical protein
VQNAELLFDTHIAEFTHGVSGRSVQLIVQRAPPTHISSLHRRSCRTLDPHTRFTHTHHIHTTHDTHDTHDTHTHTHDTRHTTHTTQTLAQLPRCRWRSATTCARWSVCPMSQFRVTSPRTISPRTAKSSPGYARTFSTALGLAAHES